MTGGHSRASATSKDRENDSIGSSANALAANLCWTIMALSGLLQSGHLLNEHINELDARWASLTPIALLAIGIS
ncbi:hypothetical protein [Chelativorans xinjiangense]|uniref:hypothetical protein n=1 Tax=Chelativorans xinjiangense TaxID=2681485 RepID=UPI00135A2C99|nr:hypothetical protein [Chelativorans xinjiangense]